MIVRVNALVGASRLAEQFGCSIGEDLVGVHIVRRPCSCLIDVHNELIAETPGEHFICSRDDRMCDGGTTSLAQHCLRRQLS